MYISSHPAPLEGRCRDACSAGRDAAPAGVGVVPHALGGPWVTVRAHYGALPSMAGRVLVKGGETRLDGEFARAGARKNRSQGRRSRRGGTLRGVAVCL